MVSLLELLEEMVKVGASDLHLTVGSSPVVRVDGKLQRTNHDLLTGENTKKLAYSMLNEKQKLKFEQNSELDFSFGIEQMSRFRCNIFMQRKRLICSMPKEKSNSEFCSNLSFCFSFNME